MFKSYSPLTMPSLEQLKYAAPTFSKIATYGAISTALGTYSDTGLADILIKKIHGVTAQSDDEKALKEAIEKAIPRLEESLLERYG